MVHLRSRKGIHASPLLVTAMAIVLCGCISSGLSPMSFGVRYLRDCDAGTAFQCVRSVLIDAGYRIDRADPAAGVIVTKPIFGPDADSLRRAMSRERHPDAQRRTRGRFRAIVDIHIAKAPETVNVFCKVAIQRQSTEAYRMFSREHRPSDLPTDTAIERDAATTTKQNIIWQTIARDKPTERRLLQAVIKRLDRP